MSGIIEKLGIKIPFAGEDGCYLYAQRGMDKLIINMDTNRLLRSSSKLLASSIKTLDRLITLEAHEHFNKTDSRWSSFEESYKTMERKYCEEISLLESIAGLPWAQIKELPL